MIKINKCRIVKDGQPLISKGNEVWFALKSKNMSKHDVIDFRVYLNECASEFLVEEKEDAPDTTTKASDIEEGPGKIEAATSQGKSQAGGKPTQNSSVVNCGAPKERVQSC